VASPQHDNVLFLQNRNVLFRGCYTASFFKEADVAGEDIIILRQRELKRLHVIRKVIEGEIFLEVQGCGW
jgi:hypothetical protein